MIMKSKLKIICMASKDFWNYELQLCYDLLR